MSWQDDAMIEQEAADALYNMGEAEWRDMYKDKSEHNKKYWHEYWDKHKEQILAHRREIYKRDRDKINKRNIQWKKDNKEKWNAYMREYRKRKRLDRKAQV